MNKNNLILREGLKKNRIFQWQAADALGMHESCFSRMLRKELSDKDQTELIARIVFVHKGGSNE